MSHPGVQSPRPFQRIRAHAAGNSQVVDKTLGVSGVRIDRAAGSHTAVELAGGAGGIVIARLALAGPLEQEEYRKRQEREVRSHGEGAFHYCVVR